MQVYQSITEHRCRELLAQDTVGKVSFSTPAGTRLVPVVYRTHDRSVSFRTAEYSELATYAPGTEVSLQIDHSGAEQHGGWHVTVRGLCRAEVGTADPEDEGVPGFEGLSGVWGTTEHAVMLTLDWTALTGEEDAAG